MANKRVRTSRKTMTSQEGKLWMRLRGFRAQGLRFRRQVPFAGHVIGFACLPARLAVELDGEQHGAMDEGGRDLDAALKASGFSVLRFWNHDIDRSLDSVIETIHRAALDRLAPSCTTRQLPRFGEDGESG